MTLRAGEIVGDSFAGGGGASTGIEWALDRSPDFAINHDEQALRMHEANHPDTRHLRGDVWSFDPVRVCGGRPVGFMWFSPTCTHFSRAKGGPLKDAKIRSLAWVVIRWAKAVKPRVLMLENVTEFSTWGPLLNDGTVCPIRRGQTFKHWIGKLRGAGYAVEQRELRACDYGAPTSRKRLFIIARCDGQPIVWPEPTHGPGRLPYRAAAECIDWTIPARTIFGRKKPLAEPTLRRIARGIERYVFGDSPFVVPDLGAAASLVQTGYGERKGQAPRTLNIEEPLGTLVAGGAKHALVMAFLAKHFGGHEGPGQSLLFPMSTITCKDHHALVTAAANRVGSPQVRAFLTQYNGQSDAKPLQLPLGTLTTRDRFGLVTVAGERFEISDIGMRMLEPREMFTAQGFGRSYIIDGLGLTKGAQTRMVGNSVSPVVARDLVAANMGREARVAA